MVHILQHGPDGKTQPGNANEFAAAFCFGHGEMKIADEEIITKNDTTTSTPALQYACFLGGEHSTSSGTKEGYWDAANWQGNLTFAQAEGVKQWVSAEEAETGSVPATTYVEIVADESDETKFVASWWTKGGEDSAPEKFAKKIVADDDGIFGEVCCGKDGDSAGGKDEAPPRMLDSAFVELDREDAQDAAYLVAV
ncbi:unnamed protein product [Amoebophrya sp. A120]|nr:unnamed protein product [Amoebophrya sp. A120]|eukprot:GSA120T00015823001.1